MHNTICEMFTIIIICTIWPYVAKVQGAHQGEQWVSMSNDAWTRPLVYMNDVMKIYSKFCCIGNILLEPSMLDRECIIQPIHEVL